VAPTAIEAVAGATVILVNTGAGGGTGAVTVKPAVPLIPALVAVMVVLPAATPVASPDNESMLATVVLELLQANVAEIGSLF